MRLLPTGFRGLKRRQPGVRGRAEHGDLAGGPLPTGAGGWSAVRIELRGDQRRAAALAMEPRFGHGGRDVGRWRPARPGAGRFFAQFGAWRWAFGLLAML